MDGFSMQASELVSAASRLDAIADALASAVHAAPRTARAGRSTNELSEALSALVGSGSALVTLIGAMGPDLRQAAATYDAADSAAGIAFSTADGRS
jgi:hypothetical protein